MLNTFYVVVEAVNAYFRIVEVKTLQQFDTEKFLAALEQDLVRVDFDARTRHNHGTKFRVHEASLPDLYAYVDPVV